LFAHPASSPTRGRFSRYLTHHRPPPPTRCPAGLPRPGKYQRNDPTILRSAPTSAIIEHMFEDDGGVGSYDRVYGAGFDPGVCVMFETDADWGLALLAAADVRLEPLPVDEGVSDWWVRGEAELGLVVACERQIAQVHATQARALARFIGLRRTSGVKGAADFLDGEGGGGGGWTWRFAGSRLGLAYTLTERLPGTLAALEEGRIDLRRAEKIAEYTDPLTPDLARAVEAAVLPKAGGQNTTQLARAAGRAVARLDPAGAAARHQERKKERR